MDLAFNDDMRRERVGLVRVLRRPGLHSLIYLAFIAGLAIGCGAGTTAFLLGMSLDATVASLARPAGPDAASQRADGGGAGHVTAAAHASRATARTSS